MAVDWSQFKPDTTTADGGAAPAVDWSQFQPTKEVGGAAMMGRQFVAGGGDLLNTIDSALSALNPISSLTDAALLQDAQEQLAGKATPEQIAQLVRDQQHPLRTLADNAHAFGDLATNEVADGLTAKVAGGVGRAIPNLAGALATGGAGSAEAMVPAAIRSVPFLGRLAAAIGRGAPVAGAMTGIQSANLPEDMTAAEKVNATAKNAGLNLAMAGLPVAVGTGPVVRTVTGGALGAAIPAGINAVEGRDQDAANNIVGALTGALLAQGGGRARGEPIDPYLDRYNRSAGQTTTGNVDGLMDALRNMGGETPVGTAPTRQLALPPGDTAIPAEARVVPRRPAAPATDAPTIHVTPQGEATTQRQGAEALGDLLRKAAEGAGVPQLPPPTVAVDRAGNARTSADFLAQVRAAQADAEARQRAEAERQALGITPDIERTQGTRWAKQAQQLAKAEAKQRALAEIDQRQNELDAANTPAVGRGAAPDETVDDALTFLAKAGGLDRAEFVREGVDPADARDMNRLGGITRPLFRAHGKGGLTFDQAAEKLWQHGYIPEHDNNAALDLIMNGLRGDRMYSTWRAGQGDRMALEQQRRDIEDEPIDDFADVPFSRRAEEDRDPSFSFAGERARTADRSSLAQAQQMEAMGRDSVPDRFGNQPGSPEDTHMATGWHRGVDGKWKFEIDDSKASLKPDFQDHLGEIDRLQKKRARLIYPEDGHRPTAEELSAAARLDRQATQMQTGLTLDKLLDHSPLMDAYPDLADVKVEVGASGDNWASYDPGRNIIAIRPPSDYPATGNRSLKSVLLHEIQHAIQSREGFARGGNSGEFAVPRMKERDALYGRIDAINRLLRKASREGDKGAYERLLTERSRAVRQLQENGLDDGVKIQESAHRDYRRLAGEVEARNTQRRLDMNANERRATPPTETADVPRSEQIVRLNSDAGDRRAEHAVDDSFESGVPKGLPVEQTTASERISGAINRSRESQGRSGRVQLAEVKPEGLPAGLRDSLDQLEALGDLKIHVVRNLTPEVDEFNGVTLRGGALYVSEDAQSPLTHVASHEFLHQLRRDRPDLYDVLQAEWDAQGRKDEWAKEAANRGYGPREFDEEAVADGVGDALGDPEFLERMAQRNPSAFRQLADAFKRFLDDLLARLGRIRDLGSRRYWRDVETFRDKLADVLDRYVSERGTGPVSAEDVRAAGDDIPAFSRRRRHPSERAEPFGRSAGGAKVVPESPSSTPAGTEAALPQFNNATKLWERRVGKPVFDAISRGTKAVLASDFLKRHGLNLAEDLPPAAKEAWRQYRMDVAASQKRIVELGRVMTELTPAERELVSDVMEKEVKTGVMIPEHVDRIATMMATVMRKQSEDLVDLDMLTPEAKARWEGRYLPRFYEKHILTDPWNAALRRAFLRGIKGSHLKGRGLFEKVAVKDVPKYQAMGWELRDAAGKAVDVSGRKPGSKVQMWRDFTPAERQKMGEVRDALYRFARGYSDTQQDIAMGRLFERIADTVAESSDPGGWTQVPDTTIPKTGVKRFGKLAGLWVPGDVLAELKAKTGPSSDIYKAYLKALSLWKEGKTSLNPVSHVNNTVSNVVMADLAGVNIFDPRSYGLYVDTYRDYRKKTGAYEEAREHGLFGGEWFGNEIHNFIALPSELKDKAAGSGIALFANKTLATVGKGREAMGHAYQAEDQFFKLLLYKQARSRGLDPKDAVEWAERWVFDYSTAAPGVRAIKNTAIPFANYGAKAIPALAFAATHYPWRIAKWMALLGFANTLAFGAIFGDDDKDQAEDAEGKLLPQYLRGDSAFFGAPKVLRMPYNDDTGNAVYLDISRFLPMGDLGDTDNQMGGVPIPAPFMPSNPLLTTAYAMFANKDSFTGREVVNETDTAGEAAQKRLAWIYRQMAPNNPLVPGTYNFNRLADATASVVGHSIGPYTGTDYSGSTISPARALAQTFGFKIRTVDMSREQQRQIGALAREVRELKSEARALMRNGTMPADAKRERMEAIKAKIADAGDKAREIASITVPSPR